LFAFGFFPGKTAMKVSPLALGLALLALFATDSSAHRRGFVHTYEYQTLPEGETELEWWNTQVNDGDVDRYEMQIEFEHGLTDRWDIAIYHTLRQTNGPDAASSEPFRFVKTKLETRYRFAERGEKPVDTLVYFEVAKEFGETKWEIEPKLILARDIGSQGTLALNLIPEFEIEEEIEANGDEKLELEFEPGWALAYGVEMSPKWRWGGEFFGGIAHIGESNETVSMWAGPTLSLAPSPDVWLSGTAAFGLNDDSADFSFRFIIGIGL
jgi:hypothetical protein